MALRRGIAAADLLSELERQHTVDPRSCHLISSSPSLGEARRAGALRRRRKGLRQDATMKAAMSASPTIRASRPCKVRKRNNSNLRGQAVQEEVLPISMIAERLEEKDRRRRCTNWRIAFTYASSSHLVMDL
ncbi:hypothetical protein VPH35_047266 [Triticum aestivum]